VPAVASRRRAGAVPSSDDHQGEPRRAAASALSGTRSAALAPELDRLYDCFNRPDSAADPVQFVHRYADPADREVVAFCAAGLAFGRVASVLASIEALLHAMGDRPARFVRRFDPARNGPPLEPLVHRWTRGADLSALMLVLQAMIRRAGSIERFFATGHDPAHDDVGPALETFSEAACAVDVTAVYGRLPARPGVRYFFPRPSSGSACKRLNLFLRWMVRRDGTDPGGWLRVAPSHLVIPLDTHVIRVGQCLGLTRYRSPGWRMAREITESLRRIDPVDPVKYDFALCHLGMMDACGFRRPQRDSRCPLRGVCRPGRAHTRRASRVPSAAP
jgi:uncharacterized protein (TIGR02757 family)